MNKNTIIILIALTVVVGLYFFLTKDNASAPINLENEPVSEIENNDYIGMSVSDAESKAKADGVMFRVVVIDGEIQPTTRDFQEGRVNATVELGVVTEYFVETSNPTIEDSKVETVEYGTIVGMTTVDAEAYAKSNNVDFRIGVVDGEAMPVTLDFRPGRITAEIENGVVVGYTIE